MARPLDVEETAATSPIALRRGERRMAVSWEGGHLDVTLPSVGALSVGRSRECDVRIDHASVSRAHVIVRVGQAVTVEDAGSANGSRLRGEALVEGRPVTLVPGDVVEVGKAILVFHLGEAESPSAPRSLDLVVEDAAMKRLYELVALVARGDINVLLLGETGAGKEVVARAIHEESPRRAEAFVAVNCAAIAPALFESELFGHERGAFTGATSARAGLIERAHGGSVFLDEIGELPLETQAKLLRAIERRELTRVGSTKEISVDVRFVSATHRDLEQAIGAGRFREDLFYRLNGVSLVVPPLRERRSEVRLLAERFLAEFCAKLGRRAPAIGGDVLAAFERHAWPGNVRELRNVMERSALLCTSETIRLEHVALGSAAAPPVAPSGPSGPSRASGDAGASREGGETLEDEMGDLERRRILQALEECAGNQTLVAKRLGISRRRLLNRLDEYGVPRPRKRQ